jgi:hypothetical protein
MATQDVTEESLIDIAIEFHVSKRVKNCLFALVQSVDERKTLRGTRHRRFNRLLFS